ncbi:MAG: M23 family metallopeptidase, partial [Desulfovibrio sp.]|jgi:murein DD-endopeptidase MepM/ murein hydrolase activator NlpD|nr:M23 family metallopeptidase [Desulfovibrio sp.]
VNGELRQSNEATLLEIGRTSAPRALWNDAFMPLPNAAARAGFAEHRTYFYNGVKQDAEATHLGLDLASLARSPVPAGNDGVVVFADYLGIYGNLVVLDHGLGLQSLYSHMSEISVNAGQQVTRGQTLGRTGATGMAVGDHLHFGILISGMEVSPVEWLDPKWIRDNITDRLREAGTPGPELIRAAAPAPREAEKPESRPAPQRGRKR